MYICEYTGLKGNRNRGTYRTWKGYIKGTDSDSILITEFDNTKIYVSPGSEYKYMGDDPHDPEQKVVKPLFFFVTDPDEGGGASWHRFFEEDMQQYQLELISWTYTTPIDNTFE